LAIWTGLDHTPHVLKAADAWRQRCLLHNGSVFSDRTLWTKQNISELKTLFVDNPILGDRRFYDKLHDQIGNAKPEISQLASEAIWLLLSFVFTKDLLVSKRNESAFRRCGTSRASLSRSQNALPMPVLKDSQIRVLHS